MNELIIIFAVFIFVVGLCIGSFLNVVVLRAISEESIVFPSSKCPKCQNPLKWYDNIPLISYILLKGKCRNCHEHISWQYPIVELSTAIMFLVSAIYCVVSVKNIDTVSTLDIIAKIAVMWVVVSSAILMVVSDFKEKCTFFSHNIIFIVSALIFAFIKNGIHFVFPHTDLIDALIGLVVGFAIIQALIGIFYLIIKKTTFGEADAYIAAGIGALLGWKYLLLSLLLSVVFGGLCYIPGFIKKLCSEKSYKIIWSFAVFVVLAIAFEIYVRFFDVYYDIFILSICLLIISGLYPCLLIWKSMRTKQFTELTDIPFGPLLLIPAFIVLFFGQHIVRFLELFMEY